MGITSVGIRHLALKRQTELRGWRLKMYNEKVLLAVIAVLTIGFMGSTFFLILGALMTAGLLSTAMGL